LKILLTGATGFVGSHLLRGLLDDAHEVIVLKRSTSRTARIADVLERVACIEVDGIHPVDLHACCRDQDAVIHVATDYGRAAPLSAILEANVAFPLRLFEAFAAGGRGVFINTDTSFAKYSADHLYLQGYTTSKRHFLDWARLAVGSTPVALVNMRLEHPYGPGDAADKFVPRMILDCLAGQPSIDLTAGQQERDFVFIDDVVAAYLAVLRHGLPPPGRFESHEVGTGQATSIRSLVEAIHRICGSASVLNFGVLPYRAGEQMRSVADTASLGRLGYAPSYSLEAGLRATIAAVRAGSADRPMRMEGGT
jgi:CDP-paratose synthetase